MGSLKLYIVEIDKKMRMTALRGGLEVIRLLVSATWKYMITLASSIGW